MNSKATYENKKAADATAAEPLRPEPPVRAGKAMQMCAQADAQVLSFHGIVKYFNNN